MILRRWECLPKEMQNDAVKKYYDILKKKQVSLIFKRIFDILLSSILLVLFSPIFLILAIAIKLDSPGPVFYRQTRITRYNEKFRIFKFRTMRQGADKGSLVTLYHDDRITRVGKIIRGCRLDEISQLIDVFRGKMTFVSVRAQTQRYTEKYTPEMMATLLLPAGVTSMACIFFKDEAKLLEGVADIDKVYVEQILPAKMYYNLKQIAEFSLWNDIKIMFMTVFAVLGKKYKDDYVMPKKEDEVRA